MESTVLDTLQARGFIQDTTNLEGLTALFASGQPVPVYIGFDCTAPSLHVGSLVQIMLLYHLQQHGHPPIVLLGGGTSKIGDPSGKDTARTMLSAEQIEANMASIQSVFAQFLTYGDGKKDAKMVNNADWLDALSYLDFLREYGTHFSINRMLTMESVRMRLEREQHLSFLEFNYMLLQAYDFVELYKRHTCCVQVGGSDQWGNIVSGIELGRRLGLPPLFGITTPLITTANGAKMGKTAQGAIWLNEDQCSAYDYWQFWRNTDDQDVGRFLRLFTTLPLARIEALEKLEGAAMNEAKIILANEATALCHGKEAAEKAAHTAAQVFEQKSTGQALPIHKVSSATLAQGIPAFALLKEAGLSKSGGEARRLIRGGGARLNNQVIAQEDQMITLNDMSEAGSLTLSAGKKRHVSICIADEEAG